MQQKYWENWRAQGKGYHNLLVLYRELGSIGAGSSYLHRENQFQNPGRDPLPPVVRVPLVPPDPTSEEAALLLIHHMIPTATAPSVALVVRTRPSGFEEESPKIVEEALDGA